MGANLSLTSPTPTCPGVGCLSHLSNTVVGLSLNFPTPNSSMGRGTRVDLNRKPVGHVHMLRVLFMMCVIVVVVVLFVFCFVFVRLFVCLFCCYSYGCGGEDGNCIRLNMF